VVLVNPPVIDVCDLNFVDVPLETLAQTPRILYQRGLTRVETATATLG